MDGEGIINIINRIDGLSFIFTGIYLNNYIPSHLMYRRNIFFIINTIENVEENLIGHWLMFYIDEMHNLSFWDSYGLTPSAYFGAIAKFYSSYPYKKIIPIHRPHQQNSSMVCGIYVIFFAHNMFQNNSIRKIKSYFHCNRKKYDCLMLQYFYRLTGRSFKPMVT